MRLVRGGRISESEMRVMLIEFWSHRPFFSIMLSVDNLLMDEAGELLVNCVGIETQDVSRWNQRK